RPDFLNHIPQKPEVHVRTSPGNTVYLDIVSPFHFGSETSVEEETLYTGGGVVFQPVEGQEISGFFRMGLSVQNKLNELKYNTAKICIIVTLSIFSFTLYYYYLLTKVIVRPLRSFIGKTQGIRSGNLTFNTEGIRGRNEIGELGKAFGQTVQDLKKAEEALISSEGRLNLITSSAKDGIIMINMKGEILFMNPAAKHIFNIANEESFDNTLCSYIDICRGDCIENVNGANFSKDRSRVKEVLKERVGKTEEFNGKKRGGEDFPVELSLSQAVLGNEELVVGVIRDISERKFAESELRLLSNALKQTEDMIIVTDLLWQIEYVNPSFQKVTGYSRDETIGKNPGYFSFVEEASGLFDEIKEVVGAGGVWRGRVLSRRKDGVVFEEDASIFPLLGDNGKPINYIFVKQDVTAKVQMERTVLQSQKMEAIGKLAGGIAHDFNNVLTGINGFAKLAIGLSPKESRQEYFLQCVLDGAKRASDLIKLILNFGADRKNVVVVDFEKVVQESIMLLKPSLRSSIKIKTELKPGCTVLAAESEMHQVIMNICTNSCDAMARKGGVLKISTDVLEIRKREESPHVKLGPGKYARLTIEDDGEGMPAEVIERVFEPFYTTKKEGQGTGFGLYTTHRIVDKIKGGITIDSTVGGGTTFNLFFPFAGETVKKAAPPESSGKGNERVLIVDPEETVIQFLTNSLEGQGYSVTSTCSSEEALKMLMEGSEGFDLVIAELTLPKIRGDDLAKKILSIKPEMPVIICTGFCSHQEKEQALKNGVRDFIMKPFIDDSLLSSIRKTLDHRRTENS
ncbi:MAG: PAS domain S-box protein, partial [Nitrospinota bacterium]